MLLPGVLMGFFISISGVNGETKSICALKRSSVALPCSSRSPSMKWYTVHKDGDSYVQKEISADESHGNYKMSEESPPTLTINDLRRNDPKYYCCSNNHEKPAGCLENAVQLTVSDLQVKVFPSTEGQTVTLMCSTSCPLTENPAAYIWYKNGALLYEDWSPWYQELLSGDEAVRYSCAVKGYEALRAPEVSVDSVTSTCFSVIYSRGRMCSNNPTSYRDSCSITYPRELKVQRSAGSTVEVKCATSCPEVDPKISYRWYENGILQRQSNKPQFSVRSSSAASFYCAVKDHEDLLSADVCAVEKKCWTVNYSSSRICALEGSSVNITSQYSQPDNEQTTFKSWYKIKSGEQEGAVQESEHVKYHDKKNEHILSIKKLKRNDSGEYMFTTQQQKLDGGRKPFAFPKVTLVVTELGVWVHPAEVTEGQTVTLTCITSCPLPGNYTWTFNSKPVSQNKRLVLDPVSIQHAGTYSCAVRIGRRSITSSEKTLTVERAAGTFVAAAGVGAAFLIVTLLVVFFWIRRNRTSGQSVTIEATDNAEQLNPGLLYENVSAQPAEQEDLHYSSVHFSKNPTGPLYATVQPHQPKEDEHVAYAVVNIRPKETPE
ncbi:pregnancy-specific beta-1-glycoprotein 3-like [Acanthochromis polyacanthus]|uniref:pregnancy-specific beta-1-glycoprotein 3-like n=1 Tax=Acanthochromis polyacanthus TaxID=80966 RepID=UPI0022348E09|nr:pregnancy-specific beta-1-glycoprotein 3-like [Acanthochromis polyacanthus]